MNTAFKAYLKTRKNHFQKIIASCLPTFLPNNPKATFTHDLQQAMRYSALLGGKRLRPLLVYATGEILECELSLLDSSALAIELMHSASLIHDDLPGIDNDDYRRGKPSCHKKFNEATAILAGDALSILSGEILCRDARLSAKQRLAILQTLFAASGSCGMLFGQAQDTKITKATLVTATEFENIYLLKTAALFRASVKMAAIAANASDKIITALDSYAKNLGLAFQIKDDLVDLMETKNQAKVTYASLVGIEKAKQKIDNLFAQSIEALNQLPYDVSLLKNLSTYIIYDTN